nr:MAG TPA_asm: hypothetical protein [Caudoviricetes sp.]
MSGRFGRHIQHIGGSRLVSPFFRLKYPYTH